jgi:hypothetical protein
MKGDPRNRRIGPQMAALGALVQPFIKADDGERAWKQLDELSMATRRVRAGKCPQTGAYLYEDVPDYPVRLVATIKKLEYAIGKPVATAVNINANVGSEGEHEILSIQDLLKANPRAIADAKATLDDYEKLGNAEKRVVELLPEAPPKPSESQSEGSKR